MIILGYLSALLMGFTLGLLGGGGSILAVPIFLYIYGYSPIEATSFSLFAVSIASASGFLRQLKLGNVEIKTGLIFAAPSIVAVLIMRRLVIPAMPTEFFSIGSFDITRDLLILLSFAFVMLFAGYKMIKGRPAPSEDSKPDTPASNLQVVSRGGFVGVVTGFVGAGGGFLIVPSLNVFFKMPIKKAMGTSLLIIAINSFIGFVGALNLIETVPWTFLMSFAALSVVGIFVGTHFNAKINPSRLKKGFGYFVVLMAILIIIKR